MKKNIIPNKYLQRNEMLFNLKYDNNYHPDITIVVQDRLFYAHKIILSSVSIYFETLFNSGIGEQNPIDAELKEKDPVAFEWIIKHIYTGNIKMNSRNVYDILELIQFLQIDINIINLLDQNDDECLAEIHKCCDLNQLLTQELLAQAHKTSSPLYNRIIKTNINYIYNNLPDFFDSVYLCDIINCLSLCELHNIVKKYSNITDIMWYHTYNIDVDIRYDEEGDCNFALMKILSAINIKQAYKSIKKHIKMGPELDNSVVGDIISLTYRMNDNDNYDIKLSSLIDHISLWPTVELPNFHLLCPNKKYLPKIDKYWSACRSEQIDNDISILYKYYNANANDIINIININEDFLFRGVLEGEIPPRGC